MVLARAEYTEPGSIAFAILAVKPAAVLGLCYRSESREVLMLANCSQQAVEVLLPPLAEGYWSPILEDKLYQDGLHGGKMRGWRFPGMGTAGSAGAWINDVSRNDGTTPAGPSSPPLPRRRQPLFPGDRR